MEARPDTSPQYYNRERAEIIPLLHTDYRTVLEVGCGAGLFSGNLTLDCETWGCEPNEQAANDARERLGNVLPGKYEDIADELPDEYFDLVICNDVIEHMDDHDRFFRSISTKMKPAGTLVGSVPNIRHIRALYHLCLQKDWQYQDSGIFDRTHLRFFTKKSLLRTLDEHGFVVEECVGINGTSNKLYRAIMFAIKAVTLWSHGDIEFVQFAFRARRRTPQRTTEHQ